MISEPLTDDEKRILLKLARQSIELAAGHHPLPILVLSEFSAPLQQEGASFVTLTENGELRGCVGALEPYQPLVQDVCEHAAAAAMDDGGAACRMALTRTWLRCASNSTGSSGC